MTRLARSVFTIARIRDDVNRLYAERGNLRRVAVHVHSHADFHAIVTAAGIVVYYRDTRAAAGTIFGIPILENPLLCKPGEVAVLRTIDQGRWLAAMLIDQGEQDAD